MNYFKRLLDAVRMLNSQLQILQIEVTRLRKEMQEANALEYMNQLKDEDQ